MKKGQILLGVIGAEVHGIEQRQILSGIIEQAQRENAHVAVFSNIFNPLESENAECCENRIFDLILSQDLDAVIMLAESFVNDKLRENVCKMLLQRTDIPVLLVGVALPGFDSARVSHISTSDANDIEEITDHLIECHGYRDIELLTGPLFMEVSQTRIEGYRRSLEKHGIVFDGNKVREGDFWYFSGETLAKRYLSGELPTPQALICANDYMAFGVLDAFEYAGVNILDRLAVVGYEFIPQRNLHTPLLTTYQRNRHALGIAAAEIILRKLRNEAEQPFEPPRGRLIHGVTCSCSVSRAQHEELVAARLDKQYADWSLKSELERQLTECVDMNDFSYSAGEFMFMVREVDNIYLCLFEDWFRRDSTAASDILLCRSVNPWADHTEFRLKRLNLSAMVARENKPAAFYYLPLFFKDKLFGYCVLQYNHPDTYDESCRNWLKSISNGLEFLRLKADVKYLLQCRTLSVSYDSMTGMYNADGLQNAYRLMHNAADLHSVTAMLLRLGTEADSLYYSEDAEALVGSLLASAEVMQAFQGNGGICGRISEFDFLLLLPTDTVPPVALTHAACAQLIASGAYANADSFLCVADNFPCDTSLDELLNVLTKIADTRSERLAAGKMLPYFVKMNEIRDSIYKCPTAEWNIEKSAATFGFNMNYFNRKYKECFGVSFHQDCIRSRILYAAHLLLTARLTVAKTAERCGYTDSKYFIRQFSAVAGISPKQFRSKIGGLGK